MREETEFPYYYDMTIVWSRHGEMLIWMSENLESDAYDIIDSPIPEIYRDRLVFRNEEDLVLVKTKFIL